MKSRHIFLLWFLTGIASITGTVSAQTKPKFEPVLRRWKNRTLFRIGLRMPSLEFIFTGEFIPFLPSPMSGIPANMYIKKL
jgi:hypothetical protein